jgi:hypothetical protein
MECGRGAVWPSAIAGVALAEGSGPGLIIAFFFFFLASFVEVALSFSFCSVFSCLLRGALCCGSAAMSSFFDCERSSLSVLSEGPLVSVRSSSLRMAS